ncbi:MAG: crossover junction endodeoxyribonuclease RuvC [Clostridia bacterium]|nr:crossover junction endodeoxyribonuclease RuvC [Clostridia bacterium]
MIVLGIDPGYAIVGYGIVDYNKNKYRVLEYGSITTDSKDSFSKRLHKIAEDLEEIIKRYKINAAAIEELFFNTNTKTAINVAQARGVILSILEKNSVLIYEYTPLQVKQALVGYGRADKLQMKTMIKTFLNLEKMPKLDDTTDALAIAVCHTHSCKFNSIKLK